jgi:hypothetical protein
MSVGALLVRPSRLRTEAPAFAGPGGDIGAIVTAVVVDAARDEPRIPPAVDAAFAALGTRVMQRISGGIDAASARIAAVVDPLLQSVLSPFEQAGSDAAAIAAAVGDVLDAAVGAVADLDVDEVEQTFDVFITALTTDLGLSVDVLRTELVLTVEDVAARLAADEPACAAALRRLAGRMSAATVPELDFGGLGSLLLDDLRRRGLDRATEVARCVAEQVRTAAGHAADVVAAVPFTGLGTASVRTAAVAAAAAADERHAWYATWLLGYKRPLGSQIGLMFVPFEGPDEVWVAEGQVTRRNKWRADQSLGPGEDWTQALIFKAEAALSDLQANGLEGTVTFGRVRPETMEAVALWTSVATSGLEALAHVYSLEEGDLGSNFVQVFTNTIEAIVAGTHQRPLPWYFDHLLLRTVFTLGVSLEGIQTRASTGFAFWLTLAGPDVGEVVITHLAVHALRDVVLSIMTLANHTSAPGDPRKAQNRLEVDGVVAVFTWLAGKLAMLAIGREEYNLLFKDAGNTKVLLLAHNLLLTPILAMFGYAAGWVVARGIAGDFKDITGFGTGIGKAALTAALTFVPSLFLAKEGDTAGGTFNPDGLDFEGYPDPDASPYKLPWTEGLSVYVGQGNQGFFSHHTLSGEVYAYDFGLDEDEPVLAARPGTIIAIEENFDDGNPDDPNLIRLRHDVDDAGNAIPPNSDHDKDADGAVVRTYASYLHGRKGSVTAAFGGVTPAVGTTVRQGQPIMFAGDTGNSFHNHLHLEVHPDNGSGAPALGRTIPFVFADVRHDIRSLGLRDQGVPYHFDFYTAGG